MAKYKIEINTDECTGCGACAASCPDAYDMKDDDSGMQKAAAKNADIDDLGCALDAAQVCPVNCIHIIETETGKKLI